MNNRIMQLMLAGAVALVLGACGGDENSAGTATKVAQQKAALEIAAKINAERMERATSQRK